VFFKINDRDVAIAIYNVPHCDVQFFSGWFEGRHRGITTGQLMLSTNLAVFVSTMSMEAP